MRRRRKATTPDAVLRTAERLGGWVARRMNQHTTSYKRAHRVIACLNREQVDFLDKLGKDALFSSGTKLSRTGILAAMVNALRRLRLDGEGINSMEALERRILALLEQHRTTRPSIGG